jgi:pyruvate dehydrogenase E1 component alpha subunit/2-oxoisovalerate dehydrogenase E1 component alpha subunit
MDISDDDPDIALFRVLRDDGSADPGTDPLLRAETLIRAYREMRRVRALDARMSALQRQGRVSFYGSAQGQEAVPLGVALAADADDWIFPALREQAAMLLRGFPLSALVAQIFGNAGDLLKGRQMPSHPSGRAVHQVSWSSCIGTQLPHAVGAAWAMRARGTKAVAIGFLGDGATSEPDFHAAMNLAGVWKVPCVLVCQNNQWAISVPVGRQTASRTIAVKARAYGMPGRRVDGNDLLAVYAVAREALDHARVGGGPTFIEAVTYRMGPHSTSDDPSRYRPQSQVDAWARRDPLDRLRKHLSGLGVVTDQSDAQMDREISEDIARAIHEVEALPPVDPASLFEDVYANPPSHLIDQRQELKRDAPPPR